MVAAVELQEVFDLFAQERADARVLARHGAAAVGSKMNELRPQRTDLIRFANRRARKYLPQCVNDLRGLATFQRLDRQEFDDCLIALLAPITDVHDHLALRRNARRLVTGDGDVSHLAYATELLHREHRAKRFHHVDGVHPSAARRLHRDGRAEVLGRLLDGRVDDVGVSRSRPKQSDRGGRVHQRRAGEQLRTLRFVADGLN